MVHKYHHPVITGYFIALSDIAFLVERTAFLLGVTIKRKKRSLKNINSHSVSG